jgi:hypothetical protein
MQARGEVADAGWTRFEFDVDPAEEVEDVRGHGSPADGQGERALRGVRGVCDIVAVMQWVAQRGQLFQRFRDCCAQVARGQGYVAWSNLRAGRYQQVRRPQTVDRCRATRFVSTVTDKIQ